MTIQTTTKHFARLNHMIGNVTRGQPLRINPQLAARFMEMGILRTRWVVSAKGSRETYEFTTYGWLVANRPAHWYIPRGKGKFDAHTLARRWSRHVPELERERLAQLAQEAHAPKPSIPGLEPPRRDTT